MSAVTMPCEEASGLGADGLEHLGCGDDLAGVALRVVGHVDERSAHAGRELLAAYAAWLVIIAARERADAGSLCIEGRFEFGEELCEGLGAGLLGLHRGKLIGCELATFRIGEDAVRRTRNVFDVERDGGEAEGLR